MTNPHAWFLKDLESVPRNGLTVMSTFSCGGGSSLGYKLAGCDVIAANDIDPEMAYHYKLNLKPKHYYLCPIKDLLTTKLPDELFNLDILDGSPPCSTFSMADSREKSWGKDKYFREGQSKQVLSEFPIPYSLFPIPYSLFPIPYSLFPIPYSLFPIPYSLFPIPCSLFPH